MTRINTEVRGRCIVSTALIIYPQMLDRCYTDFHLFQICLASVDYLFSTEVTDGHGGELTITMFTRMDTEGINENVNDNDNVHWRT